MWAARPQLNSNINDTAATRPSRSAAWLAGPDSLRSLGSARFCSVLFDSVRFGYARLGSEGTPSPDARQQPDNNADWPLIRRLKSTFPTWFKRIRSTLITKIFTSAAAIRRL